MSLLIASFGAVLLSCSGTQSSGLLWQEEATRFQVVLEGRSFFGMRGPFEWKLDDAEIVEALNGDLILTANLNEIPSSRFSAKLSSNTGSKSLVWEIAEITAKDGRETLQSKGNATCDDSNSTLDGVGG